MSKTEIIICGSGGHTRSIINLLDNYIIQGIYDDSYNSKNRDEVLGIPIKGNIEDIVSTKYKIVFSVGDNIKRKILYQRFENRVLIKNLSHSYSIIEKSVKMGNSNQIFANSYINSDTNIGDNNIFNSGCIVEHESSIGNHNHIAVGTIICGRVKIGDECFLGSGSVIKEKINICSNVIIGANSLVLNDVTEPGVYVGSPIKKIK